MIVLIQIEEESGTRHITKEIYVNDGILVRFVPYESTWPITLPLSNVFKITMITK